MWRSCDVCDFGAVTWDLLTFLLKKPAIERVQALADISRSALYAFAVYKAITYVYVVTSTKLVRRLQIRLIVRN